MQGISQKDRLQPSLLDRLQGEDSRMFSEQRFRDSVKRDLAWLLNTSNFGSVQDLTRYPEVASSVVNFGLPDLAGHTSSTVNTGVLQEAFRQAIIAFEPRLLKASVRVQLEKDEAQMNNNALVFTISAELWAQPVPLHILLRTQIDLENGTVEVMEGGASHRP